MGTYHTRDPDSKATEILRAMSNSHRLRILNELLDGNEKSVTQLEEELVTLSQSALSQHLGRLRVAGIVTTRRASQTIFYSLNDDDVRRIMRLLTNIYFDDPVLTRTIH